MSKIVVSSLIRSAAVVLLLGLMFGVVGCESLGVVTTTLAPTTLAPTTLPPTTTEAPTTTSVTLEPVEVTMESGESPCLLKDAFKRNGNNYIVVDYIQVKWTTDEWGGRSPNISNTNSKLRTFLVPEDAWLHWWIGEDYDEEDYIGPYPFEGLQHLIDEYTNEPGFYTDWGFWEIEVSNGEVVSLEGSGFDW